MSIGLWGGSFLDAQAASYPSGCGDKVNMDKKGLTND